MLPPALRPAKPALRGAPGNIIAASPRRRARSGLARAGGTLLALCILAGCAHYRLGTGAQPAFTTLYVAPVRNRAMVPQAEAILSASLREALLRDGRVQLVDSPADADATLRVTLTGYRREMVAANPVDTGLARKFALHLQATCSLIDNRTRQPYFTNRPITVTRDAFTDSGQLQAEYQTLPLLAQALAGRVAHTVLDVW